MPDPLEFIPTEKLLAEFIKRHDAFILIYRQDEQAGTNSEPEITYSAEGAGIYEVVGMLRYALTALETQYFAAPIVVEE